MLVARASLCKNTGCVCKVCSGLGLFRVSIVAVAVAAAANFKCAESDCAFDCDVKAVCVGAHMRRACVKLC